MSASPASASASNEAQPASEPSSAAPPPPAEDETAIEKLRKESLTVKHLMTHTPHNSQCKVCVRDHQTAPQHRLEKFKHAPAAFGQKLQIDSVGPGRAVTGIEGAQTALIVVDSSGPVQAYPSETRTTDDIENAVRHFVVILFAQALKFTVTMPLSSLQHAKR